MSMRWIDSHCHLDAPEFDLDRTAVLQNAQAQNVACCVMPAVQAKIFCRFKNCPKNFTSPMPWAFTPCLCRMLKNKTWNF